MSEVLDFIAHVHYRSGAKAESTRHFQAVIGAQGITVPDLAETGPKLEATVPFSQSRLRVRAYARRLRRRLKAAHGPLAPALLGSLWIPKHMLPSRPSGRSTNSPRRRTHVAIAVWTRLNHWSKLNIRRSHSEEMAVRPPICSDTGPTFVKAAPHLVDPA